MPKKELESQQQGIGQMINPAHARIEQLEDGIRKHKKAIENREVVFGCGIADADLYKLLEE